MTATSAAAAVLLLCPGAFTSAAASAERGAEDASAPAGERAGMPGRIVSLAPSITETLFAIGLGERVVGVTRFCDYPEEASAIPGVGGFFDSNLEAVAVLEPDLVITLPGHESVRDGLEELAIDVMTVRNESVGDILESIELIGKRCGAWERAGALADSLRRRIERVADGVDPESRPRVLVCVSREYGTTPGAVYAAGAATFYGELVEAAGGVNAVEQRSPYYPLLSTEGLIHLAPDVILEIVPEKVRKGLESRSPSADWKALEAVPAVRDGRIHVLSEGYAVIPGPRFVLLLERIASILRSYD